ncbi:MAG: ABC-F family ATP-binding cassette domain-containing protein [Halobacteriovoraceae bacterium]|jgi:ABC transport system ATP-binding/permease protein|nr:ABC-F family ATP-binding cassette domain-containing protein [Halobacteriovoraceae bacterium]MBT5093722.1 ABC-F family ATP-binding cassette domain-containing protein [Halobacteriovoraceae bacterium]
MSQNILLQLQNLSLSFGSKQLFNGANLSIQRGETIGLLGLNGQGKSSLFHILCHKLDADHSVPPFHYAKGKGIGNQKITTMHIPQELNQKEVGHLSGKDFVFTFYPEVAKLYFELQEVNNSFETVDPAKMDPLIARQQSIHEKLEVLGAFRIQDQYESYAKSYGHNDLERSIHKMSGGEQRKLLLAVGLSCPFDLILWDEPTNHLDIESIEKFEDDIRNLTGSTQLFISHDRYLLTKLCQRILHINHQKVDSFEGNYGDYLVYLDQESTKRQAMITRLKNSLRREQDWMNQGVKARGTRSKKRVEGFHGLNSKISELEGLARKKVKIELSHSERKTKSLVKAKELGHSFTINDQEKTLFNKLNFEIHKKDKIGIIGPNGVGKTTLLKLIIGDLLPNKGKLNRAENLDIRYFDQKREILDPNATPREFLGGGQDMISLPDGRSKHVAAYFQDFLFKRDELDRPLSTFSGGEKNRLQLAYNLTKSADLWIFDEPTNDLDLETIQILEEQLANFKGALLVVGHDRAFMANITNKVWVYIDGQFEFFDSGYAQVESYLEARRIKSSLTKEEEKSERIKNSVTKKEEKKLSYEQKKRLNKLPQLINTLEAKLESLDEALGKINLKDNDSKELLNYSEFTTQKESIELELLEAYEELETLQ